MVPATKNAILLVASVEIPRPPINSRREVTVDPTVRVSLERAISVFADLAAVATRSNRTISSPYPWIALTDLSHEDRDYLDGAVGFELSQAPFRNRMVLPLSLDDPGLLQLSTDRLDGVLLMAEALSARNGDSFTSTFEYSSVHLRSVHST